MSQSKVFQCPNCREFISIEATKCRFCSTPIDTQTAQAGANAQADENRKYRKKQYAKHMLTGAGLFLAGIVVAFLILMVQVLAAPSARIVIVYWGLMLVGAGDFLYGLVGWVGELKKT